MWCLLFAIFGCQIPGTDDLHPMGALPYADQFCVPQGGASNCELDPECDSERVYVSFYYHDVRDAGMTATPQQAPGMRSRVVEFAVKQEASPS